MGNELIFNLIEKKSVSHNTGRLIESSQQKFITAIFFFSKELWYICLSVCLSVRKGEKELVIKFW